MPVYASENPQDGLTAGTLTDSDSPAEGITGHTDAETDSATDIQEDRVTVGNVTWESAPSYDGDTEGVYIFTPVLPEGYILTDGASLPQIAVTVDGTAALIQELLKRIAALPDAQAYMEKEPDIDDWEGDEDAYEEAYTEWMEGLEAYAKEALAIWEAYEALAQEQQAQMPEEELAKLTAWVEIAELLGENTLTMAAEGGDHGDHSGWTQLTSSTSYDPITLTAGKNYYLDGNVEIRSVLQVTSGEVTLCLNGHTLTRNRSYGEMDGWSITVAGNATLNVYDCGTEGMMSTSGATNATCGGIKTAGTLNVYGGTISGIANKGVQDKNELITLTYGAGIHAQTGSVVNLYGGTVQGIEASGVYVADGANLTVDGAKVTSQITQMKSGFAGSIFIEGGGTAEVKSGEVSMELGAGNSGTIWVNPGGSLTVSDGVVSGSEGANFIGIGKGHWPGSSEPAHVVISGGTVSTLVHVRSGMSVKVTGGSLTGGVAPYGGTLEMSGSQYIQGGSNGADIQIYVDTTDYAPVPRAVGKIRLTGALTNTEPYTVALGEYLHPTSAAPQIITEGFGSYMPGADPADYFTSKDGYKIILQDGEVALRPGVITFDPNGGACDTEKGDIKVGNSLGWIGMSELPTPTRANYSFDGWYTQKTGGDQITLETLPSDEDITVYAHWTADTYKVTFDYQDATGGNGTADKDVAYDSTYGTLPAPTRTGYAFAGWYTAASGGTKVTATTKVTTTSAHTLYAHWTANTYTVQYNGNGSTGGSTASSDHTYDVAKALTANGYTRSYTVTFNHNYTGSSNTTKTATYTFAGWNTAANGSGTSYTNGQSVSNLTSTKDGTVTLYAKWASAPVNYTPTRTGYTFGGWYTASNCTGSRVDSDGAYTPTATITLYAKWTANTYKVTFNYQGATGGNGTADKNVTYNGTYGTLPKPERTGYAFAGWYTAASGGTEVTAATKVTTASDHTLYARWTANTYKVQYNGNGSTGGSTAPSSHAYGTAKALTANGYTRSYTVTFNHNYTGSSNTTRTANYTFAGWNTAADGSGTSYSNGQSVSNLTSTNNGTVTLYAKWTPVSVNYKPSRTGYTFEGWYTDSSCSDSRVDSDGSYTPDAPITLYAKWTAKAYKVTFDYQGATGSNDTADKNVTYDSTYGTLPEPTKTGYAFKGWYTQTGGKGSRIKDTDTVEIATDQTLYAHWVDETAPDMPVLQSGVTLPADWTKTQTTIPLTLYDSVGVTELWVKVDTGEYAQVSGFTGGSGTLAYDYAVSEGDHTYWFKAKDAAGNTSEESPVFTVKLDTGNPVFNGKPTVKNVTPDSADITVTPSEGGKMYWIVDPAKAPDSAQTVVTGAQESADNKGGVEGITGGSPADIAVTDLTPGAVHKVYVALEDAAGNLSEVKEVAFATLSEAPGITLADLIKDYENEKVKVLESFGDVEVYTDPDDPLGSKIEPGDGGYLPVEPGTSIYIRYPEKTEGGVDVPASGGTRIDIPARPAAPTAKEAVVTDTTVTVTDPAAGEEYSLVPKGQAPDWSDKDKVNETGAFTGLDPDTEYDLYVRKKTTEDAFVSESARTEVRTYVTINGPTVTGDGAGKDGNTAPKPDKPDEDGDTITYTGTYGEEYTPVIKVDGEEIIPGAGAPDGEGSGMTWKEEDGEGEWEYVYTIPDGESEVDITVEFRKRTVTGITAAPGCLTVFADDAANSDAAEAGNVTPLTAYLKEKCSVKTAYDNRTTEEVQTDVLSYTTADGFAPRGGTYRYTVSTAGKTAGITLTVNPVDARAVTPDGITRIKKPGGYAEGEVVAWLPTQVTVAYTGTGYTSREEERTVTWDMASTGSGFGAQTGRKTISGTVDLPAWATGDGAVSLEIEFIDKYILTDGQMQLSVPDSEYGADLPKPQGSVTVTDTNPSYTWRYSADGGATWVTADHLPKSGSGHVVPGGYKVKMTYTGDSYTGIKEASFTVTKKTATAGKGTLEAVSRKYDGTTDAELKEGGEPALSGVVEGDDVRLGGTLEAHFAEKGPKKNIPVSVTGFALEGADSICYELGNTTVTLYATISKAPSGGGNGGSNGSGDNGGNGSGDNGGGNGGSNGSGGNSGGDNGSGGNSNPGSGTKPGDSTTPGSGTTPGDSTKPGAGTNPGSGTTPGDGTTSDDDTNPGDGTKPGDGTTSDDDANPDDGTNPGDEVLIVPMIIEDGRIVIDDGTGDSGGAGGTGTGDTETGGAGGTGTDGANGGSGTNGGSIATGNVPGMAGAGTDPQNGESTMRTMLKMGEGAVSVTVVCKGQDYTAGVADTVAVANAALTPEQIQLAEGGETIEIRVEVADISESVPRQDKEEIVGAIETCQSEIPGLTLGMYIDISVFIRVGEGDWNAIRKIGEPIDVIIGIPEELQSKGSAYYIIRAHDGECTLLDDTDETEDTITIRSDLFSSYAIAYIAADSAGTGGKCGLCHVCPTFLGICCFIWLAVILAVIVIIILLLRRKKKEQEQKDRTVKKKR